MFSVGYERYQLVTKSISSQTYLIRKEIQTFKEIFV